MLLSIDFGAVLAGGFFGAIGVYMASQGIKMLRIAGRAADTASSKVRSVAIGFAELSGTATAHETLTAPFSGRPCTYYTCEIERYESSGSGKSRRTSWVMKWLGTNHIGFSLDDSTGSIALKTEQAEFNCAPDKRWYLRPGSRFTIKRWRDHMGNLAALEPDAHEIAPTERGSSRIGSYRFTERIIAPGEQIYVLGTVQRDDTIHVGLDRRLGPFVISDQKEEVLVREMRRNALGLLIIGAVFVAIAIILVRTAIAFQA
jgi:hypothetical protein